MCSPPGCPRGALRLLPPLVCGGRTIVGAEPSIGLLNGEEVGGGGRVTAEIGMQLEGQPAIGAPDGIAMGVGFQFEPSEQRGPLRPVQGDRLRTHGEGPPLLHG